MTPIYIFDLDGTLALIEHRLHHVQGPKKDWRAFFAACGDDKPNAPVIRTLHALRHSGAEIWIWSGRSDECRDQTVEWLGRYGCVGRDLILDAPGRLRMRKLMSGPDAQLFSKTFVTPEQLRMRKAGDHRDDVEVKREWLHEIEPPEWNRLTAVFDDRSRVVEMWRAAGVPCFQVAPGDF